MSDPNSYSRLYPQDELLVFDGGMDSKFERSLIPQNESPDCQNVEFINGAVGTRQGAVQLNTTPVASAAFDGLYTRRANDGLSETMVAFIGGSMYTLNVTTFITVPSAQSVFTAGSRVGTELAENHMFIGNGGVGPYKWDGTFFFLHGIAAPVQTMTAASATTGSLTTGATYMYRYTNVNSGLVESSPSPIVTFVVTGSGAGLSVKLSSIASGVTLPSQGVNGRNIYRTQANAASFFRLTQLTDTSTGSFTDTLADSALGVALTIDAGGPPMYNAILYINNILFTNDVNNPNFVWYSNPGNPYTFASTNFFKVGDNTSDLVRGFAAYDNYIVIFCEQSTFINFMPNPADATTWRQIRLNSPYGSRSPFCAIKCNVRGQDMLLHAAAQARKFVGFGAITGTTLDPSVTFQPITTAGSDLQSQVIEPDMFLVTNNVPNISGIAYKNRAFITLTYGASATTNNRVYVWDYSLTNLKKDQLASWVPWTGTPFQIQQFTVYSGALYGCSSTTSGLVYRIADTNVYNDAGSAINSYLWTKEFGGFPEDVRLTKDFRYLNMLVDNAGPYSMNLVYRTDSDTGSGTNIQINLTSGASLWGSGAGGLIWGTGTWGGGVAQSDIRAFLGGSVRGKRVQFQFNNQNVANQRFTVHHAQFMYNIKGYR